MFRKSLGHTQHTKQTCFAQFPDQKTSSSANDDAEYANIVQFTEQSYSMLGVRLRLPLQEEVKRPCIGAMCM